MTDHPHTNNPEEKTSDLSVEKPDFSSFRQEKDKGAAWLEAAKTGMGQSYAEKIKAQEDWENGIEESAEPYPEAVSTEPQVEDFQGQDLAEAAAPLGAEEPPAEADLPAPSTEETDPLPEETAVPMTRTTARSAHRDTPNPTPTTPQRKENSYRHKFLALRKHYIWSLLLNLILLIATVVLAFLYFSNHTPTSGESAATLKAKQKPGQETEAKAADETATEQATTTAKTSQPAGTTKGAGKTSESAKRPAAAKTSKEATAKSKETDASAEKKVEKTTAAKTTAARSTEAATTVQKTEPTKVEPATAAEKTNPTTSPSAETTTMTTASAPTEETTTTTTTSAPTEEATTQAPEPNSEATETPKVTSPPSLKKTNPGGSEKVTADLVLGREYSPELLEAIKKASKLTRTEAKSAAADVPITDVAAHRDDYEGVLVAAGGEVVAVLEDGYIVSEDYQTNRINPAYWYVIYQPSDPEAIKKGDIVTFYGIYLNDQADLTDEEAQNLENIRVDSGRGIEIVEGVLHYFTAKN